MLYMKNKYTLLLFSLALVWCISSLFPAEIFASTHRAPSSTHPKKELKKVKAAGTIRKPKKKKWSLPPPSVTPPVKNTSDTPTQTPSQQQDSSPEPRKNLHPLPEPPPHPTMLIPDTIWGSDKDHIYFNAQNGSCYFVNIKGKKESATTWKCWK